MQFSFGTGTNPQAQAPSTNPVVDLLQQLVEIQRENLNQTKHLVGVHESHNGRWKSMVGRWKDEFPILLESAKVSLPILEKAYGNILTNMVEELSDKGDDALDNEYAMQEFLDRYGMKVGQLSHIINVVSPLAEMQNQSQNSANESSGNG